MTDIETIESVFGVPNSPNVGKIPPPIRQKLNRIREMFNLDTKEKVADLKDRYVRLVNVPAVAGLGDSKWQMAYRGIPGIYGNELYAPKSETFLFWYAAATGRPLLMSKGQSSGTYLVPVFGLAKSGSPDSPYEGPVRLLIFGFADETGAKRIIEALVPGTLYVVSAKVQQGTPHGVLPPGTVGTLNMNASDEFAPAPAGTALPWSDPVARLFGSFPETPLADVLLKPVARVIYRVSGSVEAGNLTSQSNGSAGGWLKIIDDSITDRAILEKVGGGLFFFLPRHEVAKARLANGSVVEALVSLYERKERTPTTGEATGNIAPNWACNAFSLRVLVANENPNAAVPEPGRTALSIQGGSAPPPGMVDGLGLGLGAEDGQGV